MLNVFTRRTSVASERIPVGARLPSYELVSVHGQRVQMPDPRRIVHLQFRRFAGCPICKLHLRSIAQRHDELVEAGILEVAVFHSSIETMRRHDHALPFHVLADPDRRLYREFGIEESPRSVLDPRAWMAILRGLASFGPGRDAGESALGLPADFLIGQGGDVLACKYGVHADDHWSVDEIIEHAAVVTRDGRAPRVSAGSVVEADADA